MEVSALSFDDELERQRGSDSPLRFSLPGDPEEAAAYLLERFAMVAKARDCRESFRTPRHLDASLTSCLPPRQTLGSLARLCENIH